MFKNKDWLPKAQFWDPVVMDLKEYNPVPVFSLPEVLLYNDWYPGAVLKYRQYYLTMTDTDACICRAAAVEK